MNKATTKEINIEFILESLDRENMKCNINEKIINVFEAYSKKIGIDLNSLFFLYNGDIINDFEKTFEQLANRDNKTNMEIKILVYKANEDNNTINVYFSEGNITSKFSCNKNETIRSVCDRYEKDSNFKPNSRIYKYEGNELDLGKTFAYYNNSKNDIFIKVYPKTLVIIIFTYLGALYTVECYKEDTIEDICSDFASKNNFDKKKVMFKYKDSSINQKLTLNEFLNENNIININDIKIDVIDSHFFPSFIALHKVKLIIALSITTVAVATFIPVYIILNKKDDDYFIKSIYFSKGRNESIKLISDNFNLNKIKKIKIDDKEIEPTKTFTFNMEGEHTVYYSFNSFSKDSLLSINDGNGIFNGIENLLSVEFTEYKENYPDVRFYEMFKNCINLKSVDLSKIELKYKAGDSYDNGKDYSSEYFNSINYMFYNCSSLTSVKFPSSKIIPRDMSYSFAYCSSLKGLFFNFSGDYSKSKSMSNAFRNCTSLVHVDLKFDNDFEDFSYLFMGCTSLVNKSLSQVWIVSTKFMNHMYYDCRSLQNVIIEPYNSTLDYLYPTNLIDISYMFSGCSSLVSIDIKIKTKNIKNYEGLFFNCNNLKFINITYFTHNNLPDTKLTIFNDKFPLDAIIHMNRDFYTKIKKQIPSNSTQNIKFENI